MNEEIFSIIMPAYNAEKTIVESIDSVLNQTFKDFKLYIIDDASNDTTVDIVKSFNDERIILIKNEINSGVAETRNVGIKLCAGKYISFIDSDDLWQESKLENQYYFLTNGKNVVCSNYSVFCDDGRKYERLNPEIISYRMMLKSNYIGNLTGAYNAELLGKFYQKAIGHEDYLMWLSIIRKAGLAYCIQKSLAKYRLSNTSVSSNKLRVIKWQWNIYVRELKLPLFKSLFYFTCYIFSAIKKRV